MVIDPPSLCRKICSNVADFFLRKKEPGFKKPPLSFGDQAKLLLSRGLIADENELTHALTQINYYRLSGYLYPFKREGEENFVDGVTLHEIRDRYLLDKKLRLLIFDAIEIIEISILRSRLVEYFALKYGTFCYTEAKNFKDREHSPPSFHDDLLRSAKDILGSNIDYINRYKEHYPDSKHIPFWMLVEKMTFGELSRFLGNMRRADRIDLANQFDIPYGIFVSWMHAIAHVRNLCAHHERLWNRYISVTPKIPDYKNLPEFHKPVNISKAKSKIFPTVVVIQFLLNKIDPMNDWGRRLNTLINGYVHLPIRKIGFPENWRQQAFFGLIKDDEPESHPL